MSKPRSPNGCGPALQKPLAAALASRFALAIGLLAGAAPAAASREVDRLGFIVKLFAEIFGEMFKFLLVLAALSAIATGLCLVWLWHRRGRLDAAATRKPRPSNFKPPPGSVDAPPRLTVTAPSEQSLQAKA